ncbi:MAG: COG4223 family protein [Bradyrhizobium sp.]
MVDDRPEQSGPSPDSDRPKRPPPTIDLEATDLSGEPPMASGEAQPEPTPETASAEPVSEPDSPARPISPWVIAPVSGAVAAALVIGVGWLLGWPAIQPASPVAPQLNAAAMDDLTARIAGLESKIGNLATPAVAPAAAARLEALEKSLAALRGELATTRAQGEKFAAAINDLKAAPREGAPPPDLAAVNARIAAIESAVRTKAADAKPADDIPLRRVVAAALLDVMVRIGDPYPAALEAAKALAPNADALRPLDEFAAKGVPSVAKLSSELLTVVPKLSPAAQQENATSGSGIVERLQAGAAKLVRIERTDTTGNDRGAVVARVTAAALHNDLAVARRELNTLAPADRAAAQSWLEKADARDAALAASRQFAAEAMAVLAKPGQ